LFPIGGGGFPSEKYPTRSKNPSGVCQFTFKPCETPLKNISTRAFLLGSFPQGKRKKDMCAWNPEGYKSVSARRPIFFPLERRWFSTLQKEFANGKGGVLGFGFGGEQNVSSLSSGEKGGRISREKKRRRERDRETPLDSSLGKHQKQFQESKYKTASRETGKPFAKSQKGKIVIKELIADLGGKMSKGISAPT